VKLIPYQPTDDPWVVTVNGVPVRVDPAWRREHSYSRYAPAYAFILGVLLSSPLYWSILCA
jgi:hypothetical protein